MGQLLPGRPMSTAATNGADVLFSTENGTGTAFSKVYSENIKKVLVLL